MKEYICTLHNTHSVSETILVLFLRGKVRKFFYFEIYDVEVNYIICHSSEYKLWHVKYIWCGLNSNSYFKKEKIEKIQTSNMWMSLNKKFLQIVHIFSSVHLSFRRATTGSKSTQKYRVEERKWKTRKTLARGVYPLHTPLHTNGKEINGTTRNIF